MANDSKRLRIADRIDDSMMTVEYGIAGYMKDYSADSLEVDMMIHNAFVTADESFLVDSSALRIAYCTYLMKVDRIVDNVELPSDAELPADGELPADADGFADSCSMKVDRTVDDAEASADVDGFPDMAARLDTVNLSLYNEEGGHP